MKTSTVLLLGGLAAVGVYFAVSQSDAKSPGKQPPGQTTGAPKVPRTYTIRNVGNDGSAENLVKAWIPATMTDKAALDREVSALFAKNPQAKITWTKGVVLLIPDAWPPAPKEFQAPTDLSAANKALEDNLKAIGQVGQILPQLGTSQYAPKGS